MKHNIKITVILFSMFIITQFIGIYVVNHYSPTKIINGIVTEVDNPDLPFGLKSPEIKQETDYRDFFYGIVFAFIIAISLLFLLTKFDAKFVLRLWFFFVVTIALGITFVAMLPKYQYTAIMALVIALPLAFVKIYKRDFLIHNLTELFIYPGIASVFVPILNVYTIVILLIIISAYDMWAVWHSGIMQKMAKYQINELNIFGGFFIPYADKKVKRNIKLMREKYKNKKTLEKKLKNKKFKVNVAILGGGDVIFPIIAAGVMLKTLGLGSAIFVVIGATLGVGYLFLFSRKKEFYPAMPFITAGIFIGMLLSYFVF